MRTDEILSTVLKDLKIPHCYVTANMMQNEVKMDFKFLSEPQRIIPPKSGIKKPVELHEVKVSPYEKRHDEGKSVVLMPSSLFPTLLAYVDTYRHTVMAVHVQQRQLMGEKKKKKNRMANTKLNLQIEIFSKMKKSFPGAHVRRIEIDFGLF